MTALALLIAALLGLQAMLLALLTANVSLLFAVAGTVMFELGLRLITAARA